MFQKYYPELRASYAYWGRNCENVKYYVPDALYKGHFMSDDRTFTKNVEIKPIINN